MDKLDQLLAAHTRQSVEDEAKHFLSLDVSDIEYNEEIKKRALRYAFKRSRYSRKQQVVRVLLVACLVVMLAAITACMTFPELCDAIWNSVVEWYDDYIKVRFEETTEVKKDTDGIATIDSLSPEKANTSSCIVEKEIAAPPTTIEHKAYMTFMPEGYYAEFGEEDPRYIFVNCFDETKEFKFYLMQGIIDHQSAYLDTQQENLIELEINGFPAVLREQTLKSSGYSLIWTDGLYYYTLYGEFESLTELVQIAESVTLEN